MPGLAPAHPHEARGSGGVPEADNAEKAWHRSGVLLNPPEDQPAYRRRSSIDMRMMPPDQWPRRRSALGHMPAHRETVALGMAASPPKTIPSLPDGPT